MSRKKNNKPKRNANLAVTPAKVVYESKKAAAVNNGADPFDKELKNGKPSYVFKAQQAGDYRKIGAYIRDYRRKNPDCTYVDMYSKLRERFPWIFDKDMVSGNISKIINGDKLWRSCYFTNKDELIALAELRIEELLDDDDTKPETIIRAYDTLKKYEEVKIEEEDDNNKIVFGFSD